MFADQTAQAYLPMQSGLRIVRGMTHHIDIRSLREAFDTVRRDSEAGQPSWREAVERQIVSMLEATDPAGTTNDTMMPRQFAEASREAAEWHATIAALIAEWLDAAPAASDFARAIATCAQGYHAEMATTQEGSFRYFSKVAELDGEL